MIDGSLDATAQAELVRSGQISPAELVEETIKRIEHVNPQVNAVTIPTYDKARAEAATAEGPFRGVPYLIKDNIASKGDLYTASIAGVKEAGYLSDHDAHLVQHMRSAGFVLAGRTNTPELAIVDTTEPEAWGPTCNPWDTRRSVGGSSGGSAAAVAAGMVAVAHGNDGGGSVREPAAKCGVVGLKPTRGRFSQGPEVIDSDNASGLAHDGFIARSVRDIAALLDVAGGHRAGDAYTAPPPVRPFVEEVGAAPGRLRIGVLTHDPAGVGTVDPECVAGARKVADLLSDLGHDVQDGYPDVLQLGSWPLEVQPVVAVIMLREVERFGRMIGRPLTAADMEAQTWAYAEAGRTITGAQYAAGVDCVRERGREIEKWWEQGWDILLTPTMTNQTPLLGLFTPSTDDPYESLGMSASTFTVPFNISGQPALSLPLHWAADGMPIGVQIGGAYGREDLLLRLAAQLETAMPWADRRPPISA